MNLPDCSIDKKRNIEKCQKFTDPLIADEMLDLIDYKEKVFGKKVLENSFGSGVFLEKIVIRYIEASIREGYSRTDIQKGLSDDIYGFEVDEKLVEQVVKKLDSIVAHYSIPKVLWSIFCHDALSFIFFISFDYVIGNPPYLNYRDMNVKTREVLRQSFQACKAGKFDYCYAFLEKGINVLSRNGKMIQLVPANIYKNVFGRNLRSILLPYVSEIWEYPKQKIFGETLTTSSILYVSKSSKRKAFKYVNKTDNQRMIIRKDTLASKWIFKKADGRAHGGGEKFGDHFSVSISIATQLNEAFLVDKKDITLFSLEQDLIYKAASPRSLLLKKDEYIIFPYRYVDNAISRINEDVFTSDYPNIRGYLLQYYDDLMKRDKDKSASWFEYGRSQALSIVRYRKLIMSTIVTDKPAVYLLEEKTIPYSGITIVEKSRIYSLADAKKWLESDSFCKYAKKVGTSVNGQSYRITCDDIKNFVLEV